MAGGHALLVLEPSLRQPFAPPHPRLVLVARVTARVAVVMHVRTRSSSVRHGSHTLIRRETCTFLRMRRGPVSAVAEQITPTDAPYMAFFRTVCTFFVRGTHVLWLWRAVEFSRWTAFFLNSPYVVNQTT